MFLGGNVLSKNVRCWREDLLVVEILIFHWALSSLVSLNCSQNGKIVSPFW